MHTPSFRRHGSRGGRIAATVALALFASVAPQGHGGPAGERAQGPAAAGRNDDARKKDLPLEAARTVAFTTDEGSWMSLDVSPDGRTIVFDLLGDLYTLPIAGGAATRITSGLAFDSQPRYSPDGSKIVFLSDRSGDENVWIAGADGGNPKAITKGKNATYLSPEWTPDPDYIVVSKSAGPGGVQLWLYHVDGGKGVNMTGGEGHEGPNPMARPSAATTATCGSPNARPAEASATS